MVKSDLTADQQILERTPPQAVDVEQAVLGALLMSKEAIGTAIEILDKDGSAFYRSCHGVIYRAMLTLYNNDIPVDLITLSEQLEKDGQLKETGGRSYLVTLTELVATAANIEHHCNIVLEKATLNKLLSASTETINDVYNPIGDTAEKVDMAEQRIYAIKERSVRQHVTKLTDLLSDGLEAVVTKQYITGIATGFTRLDQMTRGLQNSDLIVIGGRPSMGKTSIALNILDYVATREKPLPAAIFSLEMSKQRLSERFLLDRASVSAYDARDEKYAARLTRAVGELTDPEVPIWIDDSPSITMLEIKAKARRLKLKENIGLLVVDYIQRISVPHVKEGRTQEIRFIAQSLKTLARELEIPVVALSQLNRSCELRPDKRPILADLREGGDIEQEADVVFFIYRPAQYAGLRIVPIGETEKQVPSPNYAECIVAKQRNGPTGSFELVFMPTRFHNVSKRTEE